MPASEASSRRSSMAVTDVQNKAAVNLLDPQAPAGRQRTFSAGSSKPVGTRKSDKSVSLYTKAQQAGQSEIHPLAPKLGNTYKLGPDEDKHFRSKDVKDVIDSVLESRLKGLPYDAEKCRFLLPNIAGRNQGEGQIDGI